MLQKTKKAKAKLKSAVKLGLFSTKKSLPVAFGSATASKKNLVHHGQGSQSGSVESNSITTTAEQFADSPERKTASPIENADSNVPILAHASKKNLAHHGQGSQSVSVESNSNTTTAEQFADSPERKTASPIENADSNVQILAHGKPTIHSISSTVSEEILSHEKKRVDTVSEGTNLFADTSSKAPQLKILITSSAASDSGHEEEQVREADKPTLGDVLNAGFFDTRTQAGTPNAGSQCSKNLLAQCGGFERNEEEAPENEMPAGEEGVTNTPTVEGVSSISNVTNAGEDVTNTGEDATKNTVEDTSTNASQVTPPLAASIETERNEELMHEHAPLPPPPDLVEVNNTRSERGRVSSGSSHVSNDTAPVTSRHSSVSHEENSLEHEEPACVAVTNTSFEDKILLSAGPSPPLLKSSSSRPARDVGSIEAQTTLDKETPMLRQEIPSETTSSESPQFPGTVNEAFAEDAILSKHAPKYQAHVEKADVHSDSAAARDHASSEDVPEHDFERVLPLVSNTDDTDAFLVEEFTVEEGSGGDQSAAPMQPASTDGSPRSVNEEVDGGDGKDTVQLPSADGFLRSVNEDAGGGDTKHTIERPEVPTSASGIAVKEGRGRDHGVEVSQPVTETAGDATNSLHSLVAESDIGGHAVEKAPSLDMERKYMLEVKDDLRGNAVQNAPLNAILECKGNGNNGLPPSLLSVPTKTSVGASNAESYIEGHAVEKVPSLGMERTYILEVQDDLRGDAVQNAPLDTAVVEFKGNENTGPPPSLLSVTTKKSVGISNAENDIDGYAVENVPSLGMERKPILEVKDELRGDAVQNVPSNTVVEFNGNENNGPPPSLLSVPTKKSVGISNAENDIGGYAVENVPPLGMERKPILEVKDDHRGNAVQNAPSNAILEFRGNGNNGPPPSLLSVPTKKSVGFSNAIERNAATEVKGKMDHAHGPSLSSKPTNTSVGVSHISSEASAGHEKAGGLPSHTYVNNGPQAVQAVKSLSEVKKGVVKTTENTYKPALEGHSLQGRVPSHSKDADPVDTQPAQGPEPLPRPSIRTSQRKAIVMSPKGDRTPFPFAPTSPRSTYVSTNIRNPAGRGTASTADDDETPMNISSAAKCLVDLERLLAQGKKNGNKDQEELMRKQKLLERNIEDWGVSSIIAVIAQTKKLAARMDGTEKDLLESEVKVLQRVVAQSGGWRPALMLPNGKLDLDANLDVWPTDTQVEILTETKAHLLKELSGTTQAAEERVQKARSRAEKVKQNVKKVLKDFQRLKHGMETVGIDVASVLSTTTSGDANDPPVDLSPFFGCAGEIPKERGWFLNLHLAITQLLQSLVLECAPNLHRNNCGILHSFDCDSPRTLAEKVIRRVSSSTSKHDRGTTDHFVLPQLKQNARGAQQRAQTPQPQRVRKLVAMNDLVANESLSAVDFGLRTRPVTSHSALQPPPMYPDGGTSDKKEWKLSLSSSKKKPPPPPPKSRNVGTKSHHEDLARASRTSTHSSETGMISDDANGNEQLFRTLERHISEEQYQENGDFQQEFLRLLEKARDGIAKANRMMSSDNGHLTLDGLNEGEHSIEDLAQSDVTFFEDVFKMVRKKLRDPEQQEGAEARRTGVRILKAEMTQLVETMRVLEHELAFSDELLAAATGPNIVQQYRQRVQEHLADIDHFKDEICSLEAVGKRKGLLELAEDAVQRDKDILCIKTQLMLQKLKLGMEMEEARKELLVLDEVRAEHPPSLSLRLLLYDCNVFVLLLFPVYPFRTKS